MPTTLLACLLAAAVSFALTPFVTRLAVWLGAVDQPSPRKVHVRPIPRLGGLGLLAALAAGFVVLSISPTTPSVRTVLCVPMFLGLLPIAIVSMLDDIRPMSVRLRLAAQVCGAAIAMTAGIVLQPTIHLFGMPIWIGWVAYPLTLVWIVGVTNAFNLIDGLDGLATGLGLISATSLAAVFALAGRYESAAVALVFAAALAGFLPYNVFPARVFLGDTGATAIGFILACLTIRGGSTLSAGLATMLPVLLVSVPVVETLLSIARRLVRRFERLDGGSVFQPDANHVHHRLLQLGLDQRHAVAVLHGISLLVAAVALSSLLVSTELTGLFLLGVTVAGLSGVARLNYEEFGRCGTRLALLMASPRRRAMRMLFDAAQVAAIVYLTVALKFDDWMLREHGTIAVAMFATLCPLTIIAFRATGRYRDAWIFASVDDLLRICRAVAVAAFVAAIILQLLPVGRVPLSLVLLYTGLQLGTVCSLRLVQRSVISSLWTSGEGGLSMLLAGVTGGLGTLRPLLFDTGAATRGEPDALPGAHFGLPGDVPVVGTLEDLERAIKRLGPQTLVVASASVPAGDLARAAELSGRMRIPILKLQAA
ncbi:MAG TPA: MraY family glycosyltransferase [Vicinamibacterales bacterium]